MAKIAPCGSEDGSQTEKLQLGGSKEGGWVYVEYVEEKPGAKVEPHLKLLFAPRG